MGKELKVTEDRVKEAAASCSTAKQVLEKLFPEVFEWEGDFEVTSGDRIMWKEHECIVAAVDTGKTAIIGLDDGNRITSPVSIDTQGGRRVRISKLTIVWRDCRKP